MRVLILALLLSTAASAQSFRTSGGGAFTGGTLTSRLRLDPTNTACTAGTLALDWSNDDDLGLQRAAANTLNLCISGAAALQLSTVATFTVGAVFSGVTTDITTGTDQDLTITPNGTGTVVVGKSLVMNGVTTDVDTATGEDLLLRAGGGSGSAGSVRLWSRDGNVDVLTAAGAAGVRIDPSTTTGIFNAQTIAVMGTLVARTATEEAVRQSDTAVIKSLYGSGKTAYAAGGTQSETCADSGDGNPGALTLDIQSDVVLITNSDANGCTVTVSETSALANLNSPHIVITVVSTAGSTVNFADQANILNIGAAGCNLGAEDTLGLMYLNTTDDLYIGRGCNDN